MVQWPEDDIQKCSERDFPNFRLLLCHFLLPLFMYWIFECSCVHSEPDWTVCSGSTTASCFVVKGQYLLCSRNAQQKLPHDGPLQEPSSAWPTSGFLGEKSSYNYPLFVDRDIIMIIVTHVSHALLQFCCCWVMLVSFKDFSQQNPCCCLDSSDKPNRIIEVNISLRPRWIHRVLMSRLIKQTLL